jgi:hypothetical protein
LEKQEVVGKVFDCDVRHNTIPASRVKVPEIIGDLRISDNI